MSELTPSQAWVRQLGSGTKNTFLISKSYFHAREEIQPPSIEKWLPGGPYSQCSALFIHSSSTRKLVYSPINTQQLLHLHCAVLSETRHVSTVLWTPYTSLWLVLPVISCQPLQRHTDGCDSCWVKWGREEGQWLSNDDLSPERQAEVIQWQVYNH